MDSSDRMFKTINVMKDLTIMKWDNCYTFVLKMLGVFEKYFNMESEEFIASQETLEFNKELSVTGDILLWMPLNKKKNLYKTTRCLYKGIPMEGSALYQYHHFGIVFGELVYDLSYNNEVNYIRARKLSDIKQSDKYELKTIRLSAGVTGNTSPFEGEDFRFEP